MPYKQLTRGGTPFKAFSPVVTGATSLKSPIIALLIASERYSCSASSANTPEDLPQPCECLTAYFQGV